MKPSFKMLNGLCVPITTPNDYQARESTAWRRRQATLNAVGRRVSAQIQERKAIDSNYGFPYSN